MNKVEHLEDDHRGDTDRKESPPEMSPEKEVQEHESVAPAEFESAEKAEAFRTYIEKTNGLRQKIKVFNSREVLEPFTDEVSEVKTASEYDHEQARIIRKIESCRQKIAQIGTQLKEAEAKIVAIDSNSPDLFASLNFIVTGFDQLTDELMLVQDEVRSLQQANNLLAENFSRTLAKDYGLASHDPIQLRSEYYSKSEAISHELRGLRQQSFWRRFVARGRIAELNRERDGLDSVAKYFDYHSMYLSKPYIGGNDQIISIMDAKIDDAVEGGYKDRLSSAVSSEFDFPAEFSETISEITQALKARSELPSIQDELEGRYISVVTSGSDQYREHNFRKTRYLLEQTQVEGLKCDADLKKLLTTGNLDLWHEFQHSHLSPQEAADYNNQIIEYVLLNFQGDAISKAEMLQKIGKLFSLRQADLAYFEFSPYLHNAATGMENFVSQISKQIIEVPIEELDKAGISSEVREVAEMVVADPECITSSDLPNPERARFITLLQDDEEFLGAFAESYYPHIDTIEYSDKPGLLSDSGMRIRPGYAIGQQLEDQFGFTPGDVAKKGDPKFRQALIACARTHLSSVREYDYSFGYDSSDHPSVQVHFRSVASDNVYLTFSEDFTQKLLAKFGMDSSATKSFVENPANTEVDKRLRVIAVRTALDPKSADVSRLASINFLDRSRVDDPFPGSSSAEIADAIAGAKQPLQKKFVGLCLERATDNLHMAEIALNSYPRVEDKSAFAREKVRFLTPEIYQLASSNPEYMQAMQNIVEVDDQEKINKIIIFLDGYTGAFGFDGVIRNIAFEIVVDAEAVFFTEAEKLFQAARAVADPPRKLLGSTPALRSMVANPEHVDSLVLLASRPESEDQVVAHFIENHLEKILSFSQEKRMSMVGVLLRISLSPSQELKKIQDQLVAELINADDPEAAYEQIESIYTRNNLPYFVKAYKIFQILHPSLEPHFSPTLQRFDKARHEHFRDYALSIIYRDLLRVHVLSGNRNLREYVLALKEGEQVFDTLDNDAELSNEQKKQSAATLTMFATIQNEVQSGSSSSASVPETPTKEELLSRYQELRLGFGVAHGERLNDKISELFLEPAGFRSLDELLSAMDDAKKSADRRNRELVADRNSSNDRLGFETGDLVKGVDGKFIGNILQNGSVAKEFLGVAADSDSTPLDTDVTIIVAEEGKPFEDTHHECISYGIGNLTLVMKNRQDFALTRNRPAGLLEESGLSEDYFGAIGDETQVSVHDPRYELFATITGKSFGIRTGFPSTEISAIIMKGNFDNTAGFRSLAYEIAQNGYYIPIVDETGRVLLTPELFDRYRKIFSGIDRFDGPALEFVTGSPEEKSFAEVQNIVSQKENDKETLDQVSAAVTQVVSEVLAEEGVSQKSPFSRSLVGAELLNIGSTGRGTNLPGDYDFDFTLRLDDTDLGKIPLIARKIIDRFSPREDKSHVEEGGYYQLRAMGAQISDESVADVDIGFVAKSQEVVYGAHDALADKLQWIRDNLDEGQYGLTVANIVLAKKILKNGHAYKPVEDGGMGGVGVENWILQNGGNIDLAFRSFWETAHSGQDGQTVPLESFREMYSIIDAGINVKHNRRDNYVFKLKEDGYEAMLGVIGDYLDLAT